MHVCVSECEFEVYAERRMRGVTRSDVRRERDGDLRENSLLIFWFTFYLNQEKKQMTGVLVVLSDSHKAFLLQMVALLALVPAKSVTCLSHS
jgi:hypothetical protein